MRPNPDRTAVPINELLAHPQAKARSDLSLGREEWLEDLLHGGFPNAVPTVGQGYPNSSCTIVRIARSGSTENNLTVPANRMEAIQEQIGQHLAQLPEDSDHLEVLIALWFDLGSAGFDLRMQQGKDGGYQS